MIRVGLIGGRGYAGRELLGLLDASEDFEPVCAASAARAGRPVADEFPELAGLALRFSPMEVDVLAAADVDAWVLALPNGKAAELLPALPETARYVDLSADFRFHPDWVYGLCERNADRIRAARWVANPGCYATGAQLALLPVLEQLAGPPVVVGTSGYSGAGATPNERNDPERLADNLLPYQLAGHTHEREMRHQLGTEVWFSPQVAAFFRGMSLTTHVRVREAVTVESLRERYRQVYAPHPLVRVTDGIPEVADVRLSNRCHVGGLACDPGNARHFVVVSVLDNLRKGAAGQAMQNLNLMFGFDSQKGLDDG